MLDKVVERSEHSVGLPKRLVVVMALRQARFDQIRAWRQRLASEAGKPAFTLFSNRTLTELALDPPSSRAEFLEIHGLGEAKWDKFGEALLAELAPED